MAVQCDSFIENFPILSFSVLSKKDSRDLFYFFEMGFSKKEPIWKTSLVGMLGGVTAAIVGHPFDTIKTRMQSVRIFITLSFFYEQRKRFQTHSP